VAALRRPAAAANLKDPPGRNDIRDRIALSTCGIVPPLADRGGPGTDLQPRRDGGDAKIGGVGVTTSWLGIVASDYESTLDPEREISFCYSSIHSHMVASCVLCNEDEVKLTRPCSA